MNIKYDLVSDAVYMTVGTGKIEKTLKHESGVMMDVDKEGNIVGIEILDASSQGGLVKSLEDNVTVGVPISITKETPLAA